MIKKRFKELTVDYVIFGAMRFGSNLLQEKLNYFKDIVCLGELYNPTFVGVDRPHIDKYNYAGYGRNREDSRIERAQNPFLLLEKVAERAHEDNLHIGFRMFDGHNHSVRRVLINDSRVKKIILTRNLIDSYISLSLARQTGQWVKKESKQDPKPKMIFDIGDFEVYVKQNQDFFIPILEKLESSGQKFRIIDYDDVLDNRKVRKIARFIGSKHKINRTETVLVKQNPQNLEDKIENYNEVERYITNCKFTVFGES